MLRNLRAEIVRKGYTQKELAKVINIDKCTMSRKINGDVPFTIYQAIRICGLLDISTKDLANLFKNFSTLN